MSTLLLKVATEQAMGGHGYRDTPTGQCHQPSPHTLFLEGLNGSIRLYNASMSSFNFLTIFQPFSVDKISFSTREVATTTLMLYNNGTLQHGVSPFVSKIASQCHEYLRRLQCQAYAQRQAHTDTIVFVSLGP